MKLEDKRKVIEVLLWAGGRQLAGCPHPSLISTVAFDMDGYSGVVGMAITEHQKAGRATGDYGESSIEAAYRLIESSPTLRRDWFARGK